MTATVSLYGEVLSCEERSNGVRLFVRNSSGIFEVIVPARLAEVSFDVGQWLHFAGTLSSYRLGRKTMMYLTAQHVGAIRPDATHHLLSLLAVLHQD